ncbi:hypothetical protein Hdeb2414_s0082g00781301 [Helianthus debilis subsp. tardiflorus]
MNSICYYCFHCNSSDDALENQEFDAQLAPLIDFTYKVFGISYICVFLQR